MKILIGTPIHECKDYCMEQWLENVSKLRLQTPADLLLVDNSPGLGYMEKVKEYCVKYGIANYKIEHLEIGQGQPVDERIGRSREIIRQEILAHDYDAWFSWECDQLIPASALDELIKTMKMENYMIVDHHFRESEIMPGPDAGLDCSLVKGECLEKYGFLLEYPDMPNCWHAAGHTWFKKQVLKGGGNIYIKLLRTKEAEIVAQQWENIYEDHARWLGVTALKNPTDAWLYQEIIYTVRPNFILETGSFKGGGALFLASMLDICGIDGVVYSVDINKEPNLPYHPKISWITGDSVNPEIVTMIKHKAEGRRGLVILDSDHSLNLVLKEMRNYWPIVSRGSYLIVEDTCSDMGTSGGPHNAIKRFLKENENFEIDESMHRYMTTNNPDGFLKRK